MPLTRLEVRAQYNLLTPKPLPNKGELLSEDLIRIYPKLPHEGDAQINDDDRAMADYVIERIYDCLSQPDDFIYEVLEGNNTKKFRSVHGHYVYGRAMLDTKHVYRFLPQKMISIVGDY
jgi:hypothetical protein